MEKQGAQFAMPVVIVCSGDLTKTKDQHLLFYKI